MLPYAAAGTDVLARFARSHPAVKNYSKARTAAKYAYAHRKEAAQAARTIKRAYQRWSRRKADHPLKKVGETPSTGVEKRHETVATSLGTKNTRQLYYSDILDIPRGTDINSRERDIINVKGFKLRMEFQNLTSTGNFLLLNVALICPKSASSVVSARFFRGDGNTRGVDFANALSSTEMHGMPINTDKYIVLHHSRYTLGESSNDFPTDYLWIDKYIKINRQFRYEGNVDGTGTENTNDRLFLCYWADESMQAGGTVPAANVYRTQNKGTIYFNEPHQCCKIIYK